MSRLAYLCAVTLWSAIWAPVALAQVPEPPPAVLGSGGGGSVGGAYYLQDTMGQTVVGTMTVPGEFHGAGFWYAPDVLHIGPTSAVLIASFTAVAGRRGVEIDWRITSADGLQGYKVYRSVASEGGFVPLNDRALLPPGATSFVDEAVRPGQEYFYRLGAIDQDGEFLSPVQSVVTPRRAVELSQNYPNPFNPTTHIDFYLPADSPVLLTVYGVRGDRIATLVDAPLGFGHHTVTWDGTDASGQGVGSGVYFYRLRAGNKVITKKLVVMK